MRITITLMMVAAVTCISCSNRSSKMGIHDPIFSQGDVKYSEVFAPWDGMWVGKFQIYEDPHGQKRSFNENQFLPDSVFIKNLLLRQEIMVRQEYQSIHPYYQKVKIQDQYFDGKDTVLVTSEGVNKVEEGRLWCIIQKPDEKVIHEGSNPKSGTIIWTRNERKSRKKEFFYEQIEGDYYTIIGYGYYGGDDTKLNPKTWFYGRYRATIDYFR